MIKRIDRYIMGKFLTTFFVSIVLILMLTIAFDVSEKIDAFMGRGGKQASVQEIITQYYLNFIPYFATLFSPLFVFISVIFFTSRMASRLELISILDTGTSYLRLLVPFLLSGIIIASISWTLTNFVLPQANERRIKFERTYFSRGPQSSVIFHRDPSPDEMVYVDQFNHLENTGTRFSYKRTKGEQIQLWIMSHNISYDSTSGNWRLHNYIIREFDGLKETMRSGTVMDTTFDFSPAFFKHDPKQIDMMTNRELADFIEEERRRGSKYINQYLIEMHNRNAIPFSTIILTLLAVPISSRKMRGGIGFHLTIGVALGFTYIFFQKVTVTYAANNIIPPFTAIWLPNVVYALVVIVLIRFAQK